VGGALKAAAARNAGRCPGDGGGVERLVACTKIDRMR
jgi:hypothetical protein